MEGVCEFLCERLCCGVLGRCYNKVHGHEVNNFEVGDVPYKTIYWRSFGYERECRSDL